MSRKATEEKIIRTASYSHAEKFLGDAIGRNGFVAVIGDKGIGKTFIRRKIIGALSMMRDSYKVVEVSPIDEKVKNIKQIMSALIEDISGESPRKDTEARRRQLRRILGTCNEKIILCSDEAQDYHKSTIRGLKKLHELSYATEDKLFSIILFAQPKFEDMISDDELRPRIRRMRMSPLSTKEKELFVPKTHFTDKAYQMFLRYSRSLPAIIKDNYEELLALAEAEGGKITEELIKNHMFYDIRERFKRLNVSFRTASTEIQSLFKEKVSPSALNSFISSTYAGDIQRVNAIAEKYVNHKEAAQA